MWPLIGAGVSAVASLLGGRRASRDAAAATAAANAQQIALVREQNATQERLIREQNEYNDPRNIRARAEGAGFNPAMFIGPGVGLQGGIAGTGVAQIGTPQSFMGDAIANAGLAFGNGLTEFGKQQAYASALEEQNAELRKAVETATLRPDVPGIYGARTMSVGSAPAISTNYVQVDGTVVPGGFSAKLAYSDREVETMPVKDLPLLADVDLPYNLGTIAVPHDGDEIMGIEKVPTLGLAYLANRAIWLGGTLRNYTNDKGWTEPGPMFHKLPPLQYLPNRYQPSYHASPKGEADRKAYDKAFWSIYSQGGAP